MWVILNTSGLVTRNIREKYQTSNTHCSKVISKDKIFKRGQHPNSRSQGKKWSYPRKGLSQGILVWNIN